MLHQTLSKGWCRIVDLDSFLVSLYVLVEDWWKLEHASEPPKPGRPALLSDPEVLTLAILAQWPRFRSERDFWRFAQAHLKRPYFPSLCSQRANSRQAHPSPGAADARVATRLRPRARRSFGRIPRPGYDPPPGHREGEGFSQGALLRAGHLRQERLQDLKWVYGFKAALVVDPDGVITAFGPAPASSDSRPSFWLVSLRRATRMRCQNPVPHGGGK
jgi:hypothetical protein